MKNEKDIIDLANSKLAASEILLKHGFFDDAYYLSGYAFELLLKAKICKTLLIPDFFDFDNSKKRKLPVSKAKRGDGDNLYKPFKVHDYEQLIILSGLYAEFSNKIDSDPSFKADWSIVSNWDENLRYSFGRNEKDTNAFIHSLKNMIEWLMRYI